VREKVHDGAAEHLAVGGAPAKWLVVAFLEQVADHGAAELLRLDP